jgi:magnesium chelatase accessory protein
MTAPAQRSLSSSGAGRGDATTGHGRERPGISMGLSGRLDWEGEGRTWPNAAHCRFVTAAGLRWLVLEMGGERPHASDRPALLLLHGTGASTHSWRGLAPLLAEHFTVIAPDLPGHGFTDPLSAWGVSLPAMSRAVATLLKELQVRPALVAGHSAGAAILIRMALDGLIAPAAIVSLNGALKPFGGLAGQVFSPLAKLLAVNPFVPWLFSRQMAERPSVERLLADTGSRLDGEGVELYARLAGNEGHVSGALAMMAGWDLLPLQRDLPRLATPLVLVCGSRDRTISPEVSREAHARVPGSRVVMLPGLGHLAHEERPADVAALITGVARDAGLLAQGTAA